MLLGKFGELDRMTETTLLDQIEVNLNHDLNERLAKLLREED
jgi:hypothetical protein